MAKNELKRQLGLFDAVMVISGDMIGVGIFVTTGFIAETLPMPGAVLLIWLLGGLLALAGALSCAELSASLPFAGGDYIYISGGLQENIDGAMLSAAALPGWRRRAHPRLAAGP